MSEDEIKILFIDDDPEILYALRAVMESQGWTGLIARDVEEGLEIHKKEKPDIILIDYHMPRINGVEGVRLLRRRDPKIPILVFTIDEDQGIADLFLKAGASDFATKPIKAPDIISRIRLHIKLMETERARERQNAEAYVVKGIGTSTMELIREVLLGEEAYLTVEEISERTGLAYQTTYRYLQFLTSDGQMDVKSTYGKKGRPKQSYHLSN